MPLAQRLGGCTRVFKSGFSCAGGALPGSAFGFWSNPGVLLQLNFKLFISRGPDQRLTLTSPHSSAIGTKVKGVYSCFKKWLLIAKGSPNRICFRFLVTPRRYFIIELQTFYQPRSRSTFSTHVTAFKCHWRKSEGSVLVF